MFSFFNRHKNAREDGETTRRHILETAVRVFAVHGYANTTGKMICKEADVNPASVNYYFGSREDLYRAVLNEVHENIVNMARMARITSSQDLSAEEKLSAVLDAYIENIYTGSPHARIWARELADPSPMGGAAFLEGTLPKEHSILSLLEEITGIPKSDPALQCCLAAVMAPYLIMLCLQPDMTQTLTTLLQYSKEEVNENLKCLIFSGLHSYAERYSQGRLPKMSSQHQKPISEIK